MRAEELSAELVLGILVSAIALFLSGMGTMVYCMSLYLEPTVPDPLEQVVDNTETNTDDFIDEIPEEL